MVFLRARLADGFAFLLLGGLLACGSESPDPAPLASAEVPAAAESAEGEGVVPRRFTAPADRATNSAPDIRSLRFEPERPTPNASVRAIVETSDPDGDDVYLEYVWRVDGQVMDGATSDRLLLRDVAKGASLEVEVVARDGKDASEPRRFRDDVYNAVPVLGVVRVEPEEVVAGDQPIVVRPEARDSDGDTISFEYVWKVNGRRLSETGAALDTHELKRGDKVSVAVVASDGQDASEPFELPEIRVANAAPRIVSRPGSAPSDPGVFYQIRAEDPDGDQSLQYALEDAPVGMRVDPRSGAIRWSPSPDQVGTHSIAVVVDDLHGGRSRQTIQVTVGEAQTGAQPPARQR